MSLSNVQKVVVAPREEIATVSPYLHGHFAEHLGELVYPGVWVGPESGIPNTDGMRNDVVDALRPLGIPVLRWPGGCFADHYHWKDGIGPRESRPGRLNYSWGRAEETNAFGTHEFMAFARALGAEPYFAGNMGSGAVAELRDWVEYCNFAGKSALADERRANGAAEPFGVRYWGIGNENWGCGGNMNPEEYAAEYLRYATYVYNFSGTENFRIACGPSGADWAWTRRFFDKLANDYWPRTKHVDGFAAHYYCGTAGTATEYTDDQWLELLARASAIEGVITGTRTIMDSFDPERRIKLIMDEWGTWHSVEPGKPNSGLYQQNTIRDAAVAALSLDVFNNHADKLYMANIAQLINVLQALLLVDGDRVVKTPTYHVFDLYQPHKGATAVKFVSEADTASDGGVSAKYCKEQYLQKTFHGLQAVHGSASVKDGRVCVTLVNTLPASPVEVDVELKGAHWGVVESVALESGDIHDHNTFEHADKVTLGSPKELSGSGSALQVTLAAGSVVRLVGKLA